MVRDIVSGLMGGSGIVLDDATHVYTRISDGRVFDSVSVVYGNYVDKFDGEAISGAMAIKEMKVSGGNFQDIKSRIQGDWDKIMVSSQEYGTGLHLQLENKGKMLGGYSDGISELYDSIINFLGGGKRWFHEVILHSEEHGIAGMTDICRIRYEKSKEVVFDIFDYKTNNRNGIEFSSSKLKDGDIRHYNKWMKEPVAHLEDCNYNIYAMKLSTYGYMAELTYGVKIGMLGLFFLREVSEGKYVSDYYPIPYMKNDVKSLMNDYLSKKIRL